jgi:two-component system sensor kinase FixL
LKRNTVEMLPLDLEDVVQDVISLVRPEAVSKHAVIELQIPADLPRVAGDRVHLAQVLLNLLLNSIHAVQARPLDGRRIVVGARTHDTGGEIEMRVQDSGPGISDHIATEIFKPFFSTKPEGIGMGLALSRSIVEAHGGRLWSDPSVAPHGAIFRFTLRRA